MKTLFTSLITLVLAIFALLALPVAGEESVYEDTLRLHILAASDRTEDQEAKLVVRDAVLSVYGDALGACKSKEGAVQYVEENAAAIQKTAEEALYAKGLDYDVSVSLGDGWFDTRVYDTLTLPAGEYTALKITLGEGKGQNFWCMLYPALCVAPALGDSVDPASEVYDEDTYLLVTKNGYGVKFRTLELFSALFE